MDFIENDNVEMENNEFTFMGRNEFDDSIFITFMLDKETAEEIADNLDTDVDNLSTQLQKYIKQELQ